MLIDYCLPDTYKKIGKILDSVGCFILKRRQEKYCPQNAILSKCQKCMSNTCFNYKSNRESLEKQIYALFKSQ